MEQPVVNGGDLGLFLSLWASDDLEADFSGNSVVNGEDLGLLLVTLDL
ncbi:MAG: hypothetical protein OSA95_11440 [Opitutales bacterium]|nr:hypothetical protein [Opitutales bacterium]